jgi:hypothetical protein
MKVTKSGWSTNCHQAPGDDANRNPVAFHARAPHNSAMTDLYVASFDLPGGVPLDEWRDRQPQEPEEDIEPDVKTTFAHFGLAYYQSSVLEHEIVNVLAVNRLVHAREDAEQLLLNPFDDKFKDTMGRLIKQLESLTASRPGPG